MKSVDNIINIDNLAAENAWKKEFMERLIFDQMKRNHLLFQQYFNNEKKMVEEILPIDKRKFDNNIEKYGVEEKKSHNKNKHRACLYNYDQILEMTEGSMAKVLGDVYKEVDKYEVRARMPLPPYMFVSRITKINAKFGEIKAGSSIEAEYDVPYYSIMQVNKKNVSSVVFSEAAHIGIFLAGYMGIDDLSSGRARFRITDVTTKYVSERWPNAGDTIRMQFIIDKLIRTGDMTLLICSYKVYLDNELFIDAKETGGFFTQQTLDSGAGIKGNVPKVLNKASQVSNDIYKPVTAKRTYGKIDVHNFLSGDYHKCLRKNIVNSDTPYQVCKEAMFIDEVTDMSEIGGKYGLGYIVAKKEIDSTHWSFKCHFKNDPVLPGTIMLEGISQALTFFQTCMGIYNTEKTFVTKMKTGYEIQTKFRGEVKCASHTLVYRVDPKIVKRVDGGLLFMADGEVYCDGIQVIEQKNIAMQISEIS
jgi:3-hydroxymyristoyl/3-hydroxydecanoyl-(acyl carrier protein) dehydratase